MSGFLRVLCTGLYWSLIFSTLVFQGMVFGQKSQNISIRGMVVESLSHQPMEYVNVVVFPHGGDRMLKGGITKENGRFEIDELTPGSYDVRFSFMGFETLLLEAVVLESVDVDMGQVELAPGDEMLEAVTVSADRDLLMLSLDKTVFTVGRDMTATGGSAIDVMESIPSVAVDYDGKVSLRGSSNVTILIDGRPSNFQSLDQIPATMIDRIEVVTNPSARYDPDGTSGIINIVMKRERQHGTNGMISLNAGTGDKYNGSIHLNHRVNRWNVFGNYDFRVHGMEGFNINDRDRITVEGDTVRQMHQYETFLRTGYFNNFRLGSDFLIDDKNTISISAALNLRDTRPRNYSDVDLFIPDPHTLATSMERRFLGIGQEYVLNYTRSFDQKGRTLLADVFYSASSGETTRTISEQTMNHVADRYELESFAPGSVFAFQSDYVHPMGEKGRFELGAKTIWRHLEDDFRFYNLQQSGSEPILNELFSNYFLYNETIHSAYGIINRGIGMFQVQAGLRAELHTKEAEQRTTDEFFDASIFNVFPSAHVRYLATESDAFSLSYSKRVNRPGVSLLNPFVNYSDPMNLSFGNPQLNPEYIHSYELGYQRNKSGMSFGSVLFYRQTEDIISREMTIFGGDNPQTHTTFRNLKSSTSAGIELVANLPLASWWRLSGNVSYFYLSLEDDALSDWSHSGDSWMLQLNSDWSLGSNYNIQARFHYRSPEVSVGHISGSGCQQHGGQGILDAMYYLDLGFRANVLQGRGSINLRLNDALQSRNFDMFTYGDQFTSDLSRRSQSRVLFLGFTYRFNEYRQRTERPMEGSLLDELD